MDPTKISNNKAIIGVFSKCLSSLFSVIFEAGDSFLKNILSQDINRLLISFIKLQNNGVRNKSDIVTAKQYDNTAPSFNVAQCRETIIYQIDSLTEKIELLRYIKKTQETTSLPVIKNLLLLKLLILSCPKSQENRQKIQKKEIKTSLTPSPNFQKLNDLAEKIFDFIGKNGEPPDNRAIFTHFSKFSTRTIRRHIKELLSEGFIKRKQSGRTVTYTVTMT